MNEHGSADTAAAAPTCWLCDRPSVLVVESRDYCQSCAEATIRGVESGDAEDSWPGEVAALRRVLARLHRPAR